MEDSYTNLIPENLDLFESDLNENNNDYAEEDQILTNIEQQFEIMENNYNKIDLFEIYSKNILHIDLDKIELYKFESYIENESMFNSFNYFMNSVKQYFEKYFGIDLSNLESDEADFEFVYYLYQIFVLKLNNTIAHFINGLRHPDNKLVSNPYIFTLNSCYEDYILKNSFKSNESMKLLFSTESAIEKQTDLIKKITEEQKIQLKEKENIYLDEYIKSSQSFKDLYIKTILDDSIFNLDNFFEILRLSDETTDNLKLLVMSENGTLAIDSFKFKDRIKNELYYPENLDNLENEYRKLIQIVVD